MRAGERLRHRSLEQRRGSALAASSSSRDFFGRPWLSPPSRYRLDRRDAAREKIQPAPTDEAQRNAQARAILKFRHEVRRADVQRHARGYGESVRAKKLQLIREQDSRESSSRQAPPAARIALRTTGTGGKKQTRDRQALGKFVQKHGDEHEHPEPRAYA